MEETVKLELTDNIALVILNRPKAYNSFDLDMVRLLAETLVNLALDPEVVGVVISGRTRHFVREAISGG